MNNDIILVTWGGIGDLLVCTPAIKAIRETCPNRKLIVYCASRGHFDVLQHNPHIDAVRRLHPMHFWRYPYHVLLYFFKRKAFKYYSMDFQHIPLSYIYEKNVKEIVPDIFENLGIRLHDKKVQLFFTRKEEQKAFDMLSPFTNPVLLHIHSRSSGNHHWPMERWEQLVTEMPDVTFIQVGHSDEPFVKGALDWRGKLSVREVLALLKYARSFAGVDSVFAHATNAFSMPGVVLFGDSAPAQWGHDNNINVYKAVRCSPCFYYVWNHPCPYGHECMEDISVNEVKSALLRQLAKKYHPGLPLQLPKSEKLIPSFRKFKTDKVMYYD